MKTFCEHRASSLKYAQWCHQLSHLRSSPLTKMYKCGLYRTILAHILHDFYKLNSILVEIFKSFTRRSDVALSWTIQTFHILQKRSYWICQHISHSFWWTLPENSGDDRYCTMTINCRKLLLLICSFFVWILLKAYCLNWPRHILSHLIFT